MCGIMGYIGEENAVDIILSGLEKLEYRGYDSAGIAVCINNDINCIKCIGSPSGLKEKTQNIHSNIGIGHNRWATHGCADEVNAHPHISQDGKFAVVHNGIIENFEELKSKLINNGYEFKSDTDTEVIAHLLEDNYKGDLKGAVSSTVALLKGSYALGILCKDYPDTIISVKQSSPLFVGTTDKSTYLASDVSALSTNSERIFKLNDGEIGIIKKDCFKVYDTDGCRIRKSEIKIKKSDKSFDKNGFDHYMLKEIAEQPTAVRRTLSEHLDGRKIHFRGFKWTTNEIKQINDVHFVACGSAHHAGMVGAYVCEKLFKRTSTAEIASEFRYRSPHIDQNSLVVIISQSGETADTLAALRIAKEKNAKTISIVNVENSTIALECANTILTKAGPEIAVATTKAYSAQLTVIFLLVLYLAVMSKEMERKEAVKYIDELKTIPEKIEKILDDKFNYKNLATKLLSSEYICFIGRNSEYCTAMEASLKLKEISYIPCEAYPAGELKHGTISLIDKKSLVISLNCIERLSSKMQSNIKEAVARGAKTLTVGTDGSEAELSIPVTEEIFYPLLEIVPLQLLAYYTALEKGCEIDKPRNLAKSVTVE